MARFISYPRRFSHPSPSKVIKREKRFKNRRILLRKLRGEQRSIEERFRRGIVIVRKCAKSVVVVFLLIGMVMFLANLLCDDAPGKMVLFVGGDPINEAMAMDHNNNIPVEPAGVYDLNGNVLTALAGQDPHRCIRCDANHGSFADKYMHEVFGERVGNVRQRLMAVNVLGVKCGRCHAESIVVNNGNGHGGGTSACCVCCEEARPFECNQCGRWFANVEILARHQARSKGNCTKRH